MMASVISAKTAKSAGAVPTTPPARLLVVEDDETVAEGMVRMLQSKGYAVTHAVSGEQGLKLLREADFDMVLLDIGLPGMDGYEMLGQIDPARKIPVLIVSAYDRIEQRVRGLDLGADDYLVKPFAFEELEARIRVQLRRSQSARTARFELGGLEVDLTGKRAWVNGNSVEVTAREWSILSILLHRAGQVVSKEQLQHALGSEYQSLSDNAIEVYVSRLRAKIAGSGVNIRTLRGFGYLIEEPPPLA